MKKLVLIYFLLANCLVANITVAYSQDISGIWRGYFNTNTGDMYKLEFHLGNNPNSSQFTIGTSYSYLDIRFYGKAIMNGIYRPANKTLEIKELKTVELKSSDDEANLMFYKLSYFKSENEEYLEGHYTARPEVKTKINPYNWGEAGNGIVFLRRVRETLFPKEDFLTKKPVAKPPVRTPATNPAIANKRMVNKPVATIGKKTDAPTKSTPGPKASEVMKKPVSDPSTRMKELMRKHSAVADSTEHTGRIRNFKQLTQPTQIPTGMLNNRRNILMKHIEVSSKNITIKIYDNGYLDDDSITVYLNQKIVLHNQKLTKSPLIYRFTIEEKNEPQEIVLFADNFGRIPPNTSLMLVEAGSETHRVILTSTANSNALVRLMYKKPEK